MTKRPLRDLASSLGDELVDRRGDAVIQSLSYDTRSLLPGALFFCVPGALVDRHDLAPEAIAAGAVALVVERPLGLEVPEIVVRDARKAMGRIAAAWYGEPAESLRLLGVTGTNGKTTTAYLLEAILGAGGDSTGLIGTIETKIAGKATPGVRTTPESVDLQGLLAEMVAAGVRSVAMEVTSHALVLHRVEGLRFASAGFTNLTQDHLDFHSDMEDYFAAKRSLFVPGLAERGATNVDDPYGRRLLEEASIEMIGFGASPDAQVRPLEVTLGQADTHIVVGTPLGEVKLSTSLVGGFNVANCLAATAMAIAAGVTLEQVAEGLTSVRGVPGRFESIDEGQPYSVIVDYAHTPDSLDNILRESRRLAQLRDGRVVVVFGCGGDRDRAKRPLMGTVAARLADVVVVTSDNPRSEDPLAIIGEIIQGVDAARASGADAVIPDRAEAIRWAIDRAKPGDVVVIAGKGHEPGQTFKDHTVDFDDRVQARAALREVVA